MKLYHFKNDRNQNRYVLIDNSQAITINAAPLYYHSISDIHRTLSFIYKNEKFKINYLSDMDNIIFDKTFLCEFKDPEELKEHFPEEFI